MTAENVSVERQTSPIEWRGGGPGIVDGCDNGDDHIKGTTTSKFGEHRRRIKPVMGEIMTAAFLPIAQCVGVAAACNALEDSHRYVVKSCVEKHGHSRGGSRRRRRSGTPPPPSRRRIDDRNPSRTRRDRRPLGGYSSSRKPHVRFRSYVEVVSDENGRPYSPSQRDKLWYNDDDYDRFENDYRLQQEQEELASELDSARSSQEEKEAEREFHHKVKGSSMEKEKNGRPEDGASLSSGTSTTATTLTKSSASSQPDPIRFYHHYQYKVLTKDEIAAIRMSGKTLRVEV